MDDYEGHKPALALLTMLTQIRPLRLNCTNQEYERASLIQQQDWNRRFLIERMGEPEDEVNDDFATEVVGLSAL